MIYPMACFRSPSGVPSGSANFVHRGCWWPSRSAAIHSTIQHRRHHEGSHEHPGRKELPRLEIKLLTSPLKPSPIPLDHPALHAWRRNRCAGEEGRVWGRGRRVACVSRSSSKGLRVARVGGGGCAHPLNTFTGEASEHQVDQEQHQDGYTRDDAGVQEIQLRKPRRQ